MLAQGYTGDGEVVLQHFRGCVDLRVCKREYIQSSAKDSAMFIVQC